MVISLVSITSEGNLVIVGITDSFTLVSEVYWVNLNEISVSDISKISLSKNGGR